MTGEKRAVTVRIAGEEYTIRASAEPAYTRRCAELVDDRIHQIRLQAGTIDHLKASILAALSITDELFQAEDDLKRLSSETVRRASELEGRVQAAIAEEGE